MKHVRRNQAGLHGIRRRPRLGNPLFSSRLHGSSNALIWLKASLIALAAAAAIAGAVWLIWFCPNLKITVVEVRTDAEPTESAAEPEISSPIRSIINGQLTARRFGIFPQSNTLFFDRRGAENTISESFYLKELRVSKKLPGVVTITVKERSVRAATVSEGKFWALDESGFGIRTLYGREMRDLTDLPQNYQSLAVPDAAATEIHLPDDNGDSEGNDAPTEPNIYPLIINSEAAEGRRPLKPGEQAFPTAVMNLVLSADSRLTDICQDRVKWFEVRDSFETVEAAVGKGWRVIMSSSLPFDTQAERLTRLLKERVTGDRSDLDYIDLRWGERVFIKTKEIAPQTDGGGQ